MKMTLEVYKKRHLKRQFNKDRGCKFLMIYTKNLDHAKVNELKKSSNPKISFSQ